MPGRATEESHGWPFCSACAKSENHYSGNTVLKDTIHMRHPPRLHVVGSSPRSGTTLLFELVTSCFVIEKFGDHEISLFKRNKTARSAYASKQPMDFVHVKRVLNWDPNLFVIYMQRDPRDAIVSQHGSRPGEYWCDFNVWKRNDDLFTAVGPHPRIFECRYEDLVADPDAMQQRLMAKFSFLEKRHAFSEFSKVTKSSKAAQLALKGVRDISASSIGKWHEELPRLAAQLAKFPDLPSYLINSGYEPDRNWMKVMEGVAPNTEESVRTKHDKLRGRGRLFTLGSKILRRISSFGDEVRYVLGGSK